MTAAPDTRSGAGLGVLELTAGRRARDAGAEVLVLGYTGMTGLDRTLAHAIRHLIAMPARGKYRK